MHVFSFDGSLCWLYLLHHCCVEICVKRPVYDPESISGFFWWINLLWISSICYAAIEMRAVPLWYSELYVVNYDCVFVYCESSITVLKASCTLWTATACLYTVRAVLLCWKWAVRCELRPIPCHFHSLRWKDNVCWYVNYAGEIISTHSFTA